MLNKQYNSLLEEEEEIKMILFLNFYALKSSRELIRIKKKMINLTYITRKRVKENDVIVLFYNFNVNFKF